MSPTGQYVVLVVVVLGLLRAIWVVASNHFATEKLMRSWPEVERIAGESGFQAAEISFYDCSPCQVQYTVEPGAKAGLPSRVFLRRIRALKWESDPRTRGKLASRLRDECRERNYKHLRTIRKRSEL